MSKKLQSSLEELKQLIPASEWKYYHLITVGNFVFFLNSVSSQTRRSQLENDISDLLLIIKSEVALDISPQAKYKKIFSNGLYPLISYYRDQFGFIQEPNYILSMSFWLVLSGVVCALSNYLVGVLALLALIVYHILFVRRKVAQQRYYQ